MSNNSSPRMQNFQLLASLLVTRSINQMTLYFTVLSLQDPKQFCKIQCCALSLNTFQTLIGYLKLVQTKLIVGDFKFVQVIVQEKMNSPLKMHCIDMAPELDALIQQFGIECIVNRPWDSQEWHLFCILFLKDMHFFGYFAKHGHLFNHV